ncbi:hypothetical protein [Anabaena sp. UHCC 0399]|uniref:hypothetical protein n=1 Tax=Anabaena sp. UHCC 0399 TaxID=3110238 RepID=UPI002B1F3A01|nr:hypothetical protein [Anabaena sp. UHCC 0399]MEA5567806.1 hypothetical protein [Anabaena sp. UHCC 0399]
MNDTHACLRFLKNMGGRVKLSRLTFSHYVIPSLVSQNFAEIINTGTGFYLEVETKK